jgi:hypothetical protein
MSADRNLLFGILALQMDFISRYALIAAMHAWVTDKAKPLGQILVEQGQPGWHQQTVENGQVDTRQVVERTPEGAYGIAAALLFSHCQTPRMAFRARIAVRGRARVRHQAESTRKRPPEPQPASSRVIGYPFDNRASLLDPLRFGRTRGFG